MARSASATLNLVRLSLAITVAGVAAFAITQRQRQPISPLLQYLPAVYAVFALGLMLFFRDRLSRATGQQQARSLAIICWALGEGAALFGWVVHYLGAPLMWALPGTFVFFLALTTVAVPAES
jgi:FtsH-binding integral membrane protein